MKLTFDQNEIFWLAHVFEIPSKVFYEFFIANISLKSFLVVFITISLLLKEDRDEKGGNLNQSVLVEQVKIVRMRSRLC